MAKKIYFGNARTALKAFLLTNHFSKNDIILLPDVICDVLLTPLSQLGIKKYFYSIDKKFAPNWNELENIVSETEIKAIIVVHYFGQQKELKKFIDFSQRNNLILIEDNAHGYGGKFLGQDLGTFGDAGISSPRKTINLPSGGVLNINNSKTIKSFIKLRRPAAYNLKYVVKLVLFFNPLVLSRVRTIIYNKYDWNDPYFFKKGIERDYRIDFFSKSIINNISWERIGRERRDRWSFWSNFAKKNGLKPVFREVNKESCPWALPVFAKSFSERNSWLEWGSKNGINVFTWPSLPTEVITSDGIALDIWKHLLCFPLDASPKT